MAAEQVRFHLDHRLLGGSPGKVASAVALLAVLKSLQKQPEGTKTIDDC